jgi:Flp pilus assembly protein TadB
MGRRARRRGPPIAVACECGERRSLAYGERWRCERCGRTWDTNRIPADEYAAARRIQLRYGAVPLAVFLIVMVTVALFMLYGRIYAIVLLPFVLTVWFMFIRPLQRRRVREQVAALPRWTLEPE